MRRLYIVETRTTTIIGAIVGMKPLIERKAYRWRWRARLAAFGRGGMAYGLGFTTVRILEEWPVDNVVSLRQSA